MNVATPAPDGSQQIAEGAKLVGKGLKLRPSRQWPPAEPHWSAPASKCRRVPQRPSREHQPATQPAPEPPAPGDVTNGAAIFKKKCASCHGANAGGDTAMGKKHNIPDLRSSVVQDLTDAELATVIADGKPDGLSASAHRSKAPTADQMKDVIAYLRSIRM